MIVVVRQIFVDHLSHANAHLKTCAGKTHPAYELPNEVCHYPFIAVYLPYPCSIFSIFIMSCLRGTKGSI
jgi:hypothetical protein